MDCSLTGSSVNGISQARILEWVAISFSRGSSQPRDQTCISCIGRWVLTTEPSEKPLLIPCLLSNNKRQKLPTSGSLHRWPLCTDGLCSQRTEPLIDCLYTGDPWQCGSYLRTFFQQCMSWYYTLKVGWMHRYRTMEDPWTQGGQTVSYTQILKCVEGRCPNHRVVQGSTVYRGIYKRMCVCLSLSPTPKAGTDTYHRPSIYWLWNLPQMLTQTSHLQPLSWLHTCSLGAPGDCCTAKVPTRVS